MDLVYLNGTYLPLEEARISVLDRGFIFGDGVYEVVPVYGRKPFRLQHHLDRLRHSLASIRMADPLTTEAWDALFVRLIAEAEWEDQSIYLQVTRGPAARDHAIPPNAVPTVFAMARALSRPTSESVQQGVTAITAADNRWLRCDIKTTSLLANVLLRQLSVDAGCDETILIRDGFLAEGASSSVFMVKEGVLLAPPKSSLMLPGITYDVVLELAAAEGIRHALRPITAPELDSADEIWLTSSTREVTAVTRLDGKPVGDGRPGPMFWRMHDAYQTFKQQVMRGA